MEAYEIVDRAMERGDAEKLSDLTGKSAEYYNSFRRRPRSSDYQHGTGNVSPVTLYIRFVKFLGIANRRSARRLHSLVDAEVRASLACEPEPDSLPMRLLSKALLRETTEAVCAMDERELDACKDGDLALLDKELSDVECEVQRARARVRREIDRRLRGEPAGEARA